MTPEDFGPSTLSAGKHKSPSDGMCVMEMVAFLAGDKWTDEPACASPIVTTFCQVINDQMPQAFRDKLQGYVPRLIGTASPEHDLERAVFLAWRAVKVHAPISLDKAGLRDEAEKLRNFDEAKGLQAAARAADPGAAARAADPGADAAADPACAAADAAYAAYTARAAVYVAQADAYDAARAAVYAARAAIYAADAAVCAADEAAIWETLDGLLEIGPSGQAYTQEHLDRLPELREAVQA